MESRASQKYITNGLPLEKVPLRPFYEFSKRIFDIGFSIAFLIISSPFIVVAAILMQLESPGPIFYIQKRVGFKGRTFHLLKLRSMPPDAENIVSWLFCPITGAPAMVSLISQSRSPFKIKLRSSYAIVAMAASPTRGTDKT